MDRRQIGLRPRKVSALCRCRCCCCSYLAEPAHRYGAARSATGKREQRRTAIPSSAGSARRTAAALWRSAGPMNVSPPDSAPAAHSSVGQARAAGQQWLAPMSAARRVGRGNARQMGRSIRVVHLSPPRIEFDLIGRFIFGSGDARVLAGSRRAGKQVHRIRFERRLEKESVQQWQRQ